ncbi:class I SAM-dependent methyltransferase [Brevibacillus brevis]|uniref:class I SAM-dependent methyltransferase n=1 Tax=Brevibacillus brevis TaxID=1393 RepID=UPI000AF9EA18|nr:class I SAM-dependent methyltransferase [Brevibacillus brevis]
MINEKQKLDQIAEDSWYAKGANAETIKYSAKIISRFLRKGDILELGPAEGLMTSYIDKYAYSLTLVDGSSVFCDVLRRKYPHAKVICSLFEELELEEKYDYVLLGHVLEHVENPIAILMHIKKFLKPDGKIIAVVPNSHSVHRQAAVLMGLLEKESSLNPTDIHHGHRRVYNPAMFREHFLTAGYQIEQFGGYWLKPVSDKQIEQTWTQEMLEAFFQLGELYPDIAAEIYIIATVK